VFAAYVSHRGYALRDKRLNIPEKWFDQSFEGKRKKCQLPEVIKTKPQLAVDMLDDIAQENVELSATRS
jgi:hypothetical protein